MEKSLAHLLVDKTIEKPNEILYMEKENGTYISYSFKEIRDQVFALAKAFVKFGLKEKDKVAFLAANSVKWSISDYATLSAGLVDVPIYPTLLSNTIEYILENSEARILIAENFVQLEKVMKIDFSKTSLEKIVVMDNDLGNINDKKVISWDNFVLTGEKIEDSEIEKRLDVINNKDLATLIYTSGTTGMPKGVMLSHSNILSNVHAALKVIPTLSEYRFLSFLPLSHIFERMFGHYMAMKLGATVAYAESIDLVAQNMSEIKPNVMASVPRLYEKIYARVLDNVEQGSVLKKKIFYWAVDVGKKVVNKYTCFGKKPSGFLAFKQKIANKLVFGKLKERVGGNMKFFVSGGGALMPDIAEFFGAAGLIILEGYGLTETSPVITVNHYEHFKFGFVGPILPGVEVKIADDGEILTKGPHVMMGYYKNEEATNEVMDGDWFHTGDIGYIDNDGFLKITDRKKNIIVTSGGKNVAPLPIEGKLITSKYIEQALVIGDKRKFCSAIITPAEENVLAVVEKHGIKTLEEAVKHPEVIEVIQKDIDSINKDLASYESIKKFILLDRLFTIESGELTPKLSIKKKIVLENLKNEIEEMYNV
jgi:long-chain acyl-CoA synthetase